MTTTNNKSTEDWSVEKLKSLTFDECIELYKTLSPPEFEELNGEYKADLLGGYSELGDWLMYKTELGHWLGKAYTPIPTASNPGFRGEGYNYWLIDGKKVYHSRFATHMGVSEIDGKPIFRMQYDAFKSLYGQQGMVDEIRKLKVGLYLCFGKQWPTEPGGLFCLSGPKDSYNENPRWYFGDEISKPVKVKYSFKDYPYPDSMNSKEFREFWKDHLD
ncbi:MAG: hypothetical protein ACW972_08395 [Promethearchaeota archaeon]|jgi:hypothetical protein